ncbi:MAG: zinc ribbon domain-containing protein, partial [Bacilli bacterium]|nr:zinc ribbon domain-containing protein [Bacilli bacterium]
MHCQNCGNQINEESRFCAKCGKETIINDANNNDSVSLKSLNIDVGSSGNYWLGAFIPILALTLGLKWKKDKPISSKQIRVGGLIFIL